PSIYVGTCGFSYRDWIGTFYPTGIAARDMLEYYARHFPVVEIDSTYYAVPKPELFVAMAQRTPDRFRFAVKVPGSVTHVPADVRPPAQDISAFAASLQPLRAAGKLAAVLAQFPHGFRPGSASRQRLDELRGFWPDLPLVAEFRNREWQDARTLRDLARLDIGWCNVDQPHFRSLLRAGSEVTSGIGYVRFHGRNYANWWKQARAAHERYSYLYSPEELVPWTERIADVSRQAKETYVFFNNHHLGQAAVNARQLSDMLGLSSDSAEETDSRTGGAPRLF
ncbi:MAG: DUF72 domain-containing protein, partial [Candidatus Eremiobacteraeota bacterium]|nr:DUF72 domain-containing protein [Candidatus Eremiobacteraeota bacterium]